MEKFIKSIQKFQSHLFDRIEKKELPITYEGAPDEYRFSYTHAEEIVKNFQSFKKESRRFKEDKSRLILSSTIFKNLLVVLNRECNIFLFSHLKDGTTGLRLFKEDLKVMFDSSSGIGNLVFFVFIFSLGGTLLLFPEDYLSSFIFFVIALFFCIRIIYKKNVIKNAKKKLAMLTGRDIFFSGHDNGWSKAWIKDDIANIKFLKTPQFLKMMNLAIKLNGKIGCLILKNIPIELSNVEKYAESSIKMDVCYNGCFMPVILLKETIIFDTTFFQLFQDSDIGVDESDIEEAFQKKNFRLLI